MVRYCAFLLMFVLSCKNIKYKILEDGSSKIPVESNYFDKNYRKKFSLKLPYGMEPNSIFIEKYFVDEQNRWYSVLNGKNSFISVFKFYELGQVSLFKIRKDKHINDFNLNPSDTGYRGVSFVSKGREIIEVIVPINETYDLGKVRYYIELKNDTLMLKRSGVNQKTVFVRCRSCQAAHNYNPNW